MTDRDALDVQRIRAALGPRWNRVEVVEQTASTNADLLADVDAPDRSALAAEVQSAGRGRFDRVWTSPPRAGLTFSALLRPDVPPAQWGWLPLLAGVALVEAVHETTGVDVALKWPNDLLAGPAGAKAAGILVQTMADAPGGAVIGIGLNVSTAVEELPQPSATSLALQGATRLDRSDLLIAVLHRLDLRVAQWTGRGGDAEACGLAAAYRAACATVGSRVRVSLDDASAAGAWEGRAVDVDAAGRLVVEVDGVRRTVSAGDVLHLRPA